MDGERERAAAAVIDAGPELPKCGEQWPNRALTGARVAVERDIPGAECRHGWYETQHGPGVSHIDR